MKTLACVLFCQIMLLFHFVSTAQTTGEWLVDMDTHTGAFEPVGSILDGIDVIYVGLQTKDEANGQYIFPGFLPSGFVFVHISNASIVQQIPFPMWSYQLFGFYSLDNCLEISI